MKHFLLAGLIIIFATTVSADEVIIKVAENNVEVRTIYYKDTKGSEPVTIKTESYGQDRINTEQTEAQSELTSAQGLDVAAYKTAQIAAAQAKTDKLTLIQAKMDK